MLRNKNISIRVNSSLLNKVQTIIDKHTVVRVIYNHKYYHCSLGKQYSLSNKVSVADIFEEALLKFVEEHKEDLKE